MSKSLTITSNLSPTAVGDNTTRFVSLGGTLAVATSELFVETPVRDATVFSNLFTVVSANTAQVNSTITVRKSTADTSIIVTYTSLQTGIKEDTSNTSSYTNTDEADFEITVANDPGGTRAITVVLIGIESTPTSTNDCISYYTSSVNDSLTTASTTLFGNVSGLSNFQATESNASITSRFSFTSSDLNVYVTGNSRTTNTVFKTRKNNVDGNQSVTYTSGQTGLKEDTSNTDSITNGDLFNYAATTSTGTQFLDFFRVSSTAINTSRVFSFISSSTGGNSQSSGATRYRALAGRTTGNSTESVAQMYPRFDFTVGTFQMLVTNNSINAFPTTVTLRDNGADSSVTLSYGNAETGLKEDTTNTAAITSGGDEINYSTVTPGSSGTFQVRWMGILGETAAPANATTRQPSGAGYSGGASFNF